MRSTVGVTVSGGSLTADATVGRQRHSSEEPWPVACVCMAWRGMAHAMCAWPWACAMRSHSRLCPDEDENPMVKIGYRYRNQQR